MTSKKADTSGAATTNPGPTKPDAKKPADTSGKHEAQAPRKSEPWLIDEDKSQLNKTPLSGPVLKH